MFFILQILTLSWSVFFAQCQPSTTESFAYHMVLDLNEVMTVYWNFDDTSITFEVHGKTKGWVGIGISPSGSMADADIAVGWVKNGKTMLTDRHGGSQNGFPPVDTVQNLELLEGMEVDGYTVIKFRRLLVTCDSEDLDITDDTIKMIFAWGDEDPSGDDLSGDDRHKFTNRGVKKLLLFNLPETDGDAFPEGETHLTFDIFNNNFLVPPVDTYYNCRLFRIPDFPSKQHLVKVEAIIQKGNELNVHHMDVYRCKDNFNTTNVNENTRCFASGMPEDFNSCLSTVAAWSIGGGAFYFPKHTGFSLGTPGDPKVVILQTHYDNPQIRTDMVDSSGYRFTYTPDLRTYDAGIMVVGHGISGLQHIIPPNAESVLDYSECPANCLSETLKAEGHDSINVFAVLLHSHLLAKGMTLRHLRNGTELPYFAKDSSYDFNFQEYRMLPEERVLESGDSIQMICNYNTLKRENVTVGGLSTENEMCQTFVYYYPKMSLDFCETMPNSTSLLRYFGIGRVKVVGDDYIPDLNNLLIQSPPKYENKTVMEVLNSLNWNEESADDFSLAARSMLRVQNCISKREPTAGVKKYVQPPKIDFPLVETNSCSGPDSTTDKTTSSTQQLHGVYLSVVVALLASLQQSFNY